MRSGRGPLLAIASLIGLLLACACIALAAGLVAGGGRTAAQASTNRIIYGLPLMPASFDPHVSDSIETGIVLRSIYDTLLYRDPQTRKFVPGLAEKWSVSDDGLTYTFSLRAGVKFQDGTPFDSNAVAANLDRITRPATKSQKALALLGPYDHYHLVDPQTIQIVLKAPYAPLLDGLAQVYTGIASPQALKQYDNAQYQYHQVGTGPYEMLDYVPGDHVTLRRNPKYAWGPSFYTPPGPQTVDEVEFRFFTDPTTRAPALESGAANVIGELSPADAILFTGNSQLRLYPQPVPGESLVFLMNLTRSPTDKIEFRRALITATNRNALVDAVFQQFSPVAFGPLSAVSPFYDAKVRAGYPFDSSAALDQLGKLGYSLKNNVLSQGDKKLHLVMVVPAWSFIPQVADRLQSQWHDLGIELEIREVPNLAGLQAAVKAGDYNLIAYDDFGVDPDVLSAVFRSDSANNWTHYGNGDLDSWLLRGRTTADAETRTNMYIAVQNHIMDQALILPIRDYVNLNGATANVDYLSFDAYGWNPLLPNLVLTGRPGPTPTH